MTTNRREFIKQAGIAALSYGFLSALPTDLFAAQKTELFKISLAEWSFQASLFGGKMTNMDFPLRAKNELGIDIVEYVSPFFNKKETDQAYLKSLKKITDDNGITNNLIMVDGEGDLGDLDLTKRNKAVENHYKWIDAAKVLGCKSIRVNAGGRGSAEQVKDAVILGLGKLTTHGEQHGIDVIVENHGGLSSNAAWLAEVIKGVNNKHCGTLPDFGNFWISGTEKYDLYKGVGELLPYAKGISAKTFKFDKDGNEPDIDYYRLFKMIKDSGFRGIVGIEWEGNSLNEIDGIKATKTLLEKVRTALS